MAVDEGLWYLHVNQTRGQYPDFAPGFYQSNGVWQDAGNEFQDTCAATDALEMHGSVPQQNYHADPYVEDTRRALNFLLVYAVAPPISPQPSGNPDSNGNGIGIFIGNRLLNNDTYTNAVCAMALADSGAPDRLAGTGPFNVYGRSYRDIVQDTVDWFAFGQVDAGFTAGGWGYSANDDASTNEVFRSVILALSSAENKMGATVPPFVRQNIPVELNATYHSIFDIYNGGWGDFLPGNIVSIGFTAGGILGHQFIGDSANVPLVQSGLGFIYRHWNDDSPDYDNLGDSDTMYSVMRAMRSFTPNIGRITEFDYLNGQQTANSFDWYYTPANQAQAGYGPYIVATQRSDGSWQGFTLGPSQGFHAYGIFGTTAWNTLTLMRPPAPDASFAPDALEFDPQTVHTTSSTQKVTLTNNGDAPLAIASIAASSPFSATSDCGTTLPPTGTNFCAVSVTVTPNASGPLSGSLTVTDNSGTGMQSIALNGSGIPAALVSIAVTPSPGSVVAGQTLPFTATGHFSDNTEQALTSGVNWTSSDTTIATIDASGVAAGVKAGGPVTITAAQGAISGTAPLTVKAAFVQLVAGSTLSKNSSGDYVAQVRLRNAGTITAHTAQLTAALLNTSAGTPVPIALGDIVPGATVNFTETFPGSAGAAGTGAVLKTSYTYAGGAITSSQRTVLPQ